MEGSSTTSPASPLPVEEPTGPVFVRAIRAALGRTPLWLLTFLAFSVLALPSAVLTQFVLHHLLNRRMDILAREADVAQRMVAERRELVRCLPTHPPALHRLEENLKE